MLRQRDDNQRDQDIDPERPSPEAALREGTAQQGSGERGSAPDAGDQHHSAGAQVFRKDALDGAVGERDEQSAAEALAKPPGQKDRHIGSGGASDAADREQQRASAIGALEPARSCKSGGKTPRKSPRLACETGLWVLFLPAKRR